MSMNIVEHAHLVLYEPVDVIIAGVVPHALTRQLHSKVMTRPLIMKHASAAPVPGHVENTSHNWCTIGS